MQLQKTVTGHALAKEQFEFKVKAVKTDTATADEAAELFGFKEGETEVTFKNNEAAADGQTVTMLKTDTNFTLKNLGKVYKYEVSEMNDKKPGYTYDDTVYTVELWVTDDGDGTLTLHTKVTDEKGSVISEETSNETDQKQTVLAFNNSYAGSGVLELEGEGAGVGDLFDELFLGDVGKLGKLDAFGTDGVDAHAHEVLDELQSAAGLHIADVGGLAHLLEQAFLILVVGGLVAAAEQGAGAVRGKGGALAHGDDEVLLAPLGGFGFEHHHRFDVQGGQVEMHAAFGEVFKHAVGPEQNACRLWA